MAHLLNQQLIVLTPQAFHLVLQRPDPPLQRLLLTLQRGHLLPLAAAGPPP